MSPPSFLLTSDSKPLTSSADASDSSNVARLPGST